MSDTVQRLRTAASNNRILSVLRVAVVALAVAGFLHFKGCVPIGPGLSFGVCTVPLPPPPEKENT